MRDFYIEQRPIHSKQMLPIDLAHHLYLRYEHEGVTVVASQPVLFMKLIERQWAKLTRQVQLRRAGFEDAVHIVELAQRVAWMQNTSFGLWSRDNLETGGIVFGSVDSLVRFPPPSSTLYVTHEVGREQLYLLSAWMKPGSLIVEYIDPR